MKRVVRLFIISRDKAPAGPPEAPETFTVEADTFDGLRRAAQQVVLERGLKCRSVSFAPQDLVAYAEVTA